MFAKWGQDSSYRRSQATPEIPLDASERAIELAHAILSGDDSAPGRQQAGQALIDVLNQLVGLPRCELVVADRRQVHEHDGQRVQSRTYGYYRCWSDYGKVSKARIRIYNKTAVRQQIISSKVFLNTLLHEWTHHYDFAGLRLRRSPHTTGFFKRLRTLAMGLGVGFVLPPDPEDIPTTDPFNRPPDA